MSTNLKGFSKNINHPAMAKYVKDTNRWSVIFSLILAVAAVLGFLINGEISSEMENPESLYIGLVIGSMFLLIALLQIMSRNKSTTWDGNVIDKKVKRKKKKSPYSRSWVECQEFAVIIRSDEGKLHNITEEDDNTLFDYYQIGDRVRYHKGLNSYEKKDKSKDTIVFCNACASLNEIQDDYCFRCNCPLFK